MLLPNAYPEGRIYMLKDTNFKRADLFLDGLCGSLVPSNDLIIMKDHRLLHRYICGCSDWETQSPPSEDTLYFMYSASKPITCTAALMLWERGLFSLDDPLYLYLPEFRDMLVTFTDTDGKKKNRPARSPILIRHLFSMTAGLNYNTEAAPIREARTKYAPECPTREIVRAIAKVPLSFDPDERWQYSLCHDVLAALAETVAGVPFRKFVSDNIFAPLKMENSYFGYDSSILPRIAPQYMYYDDEKAFRPVEKENEYIFGSEYDSGGAGIISTTEDMARFADMLACGGTAPDGTVLIRENTVRMMSTNALSEEKLASFDWSQYRGYSYGLGVRTLITKEFGALSSIGEFGWAGAAGAYMLCDPTEHLSIFCARHMLNNKEPLITPTLRNLVYECLHGE